jgi:ketosteroid isomerase-like protein
MRNLLKAVLVLVTVSSPLYAQCREADRKELEQFDRAWGDATTRGDRASLERIIADDFTGASYNGTVGKAATIDNGVQAAERNRANPQGAPRTTYDNYIITCTASSATVTHRNATTTAAGGRDRTTYSRSVHVLEKRGSRWQVVGNAGHALDDAGVLLYMENDWNQAIKNHDVAWYERNYADDATQITGRTGVLQNKAEAIASTRADKTVFESLELSELGVRFEGNVAIVTGVNRLKGRDEQGQAFDGRFRFTDTFIKRDGRWLVWASQATAIP